MGRAAAPSLRLLRSRTGMNPLATEQPNAGFANCYRITVLLDYIFGPLLVMTCQTSFILSPVLSPGALSFMK